MTGLEEYCRSLVEEIIEKCVEISAHVKCKEIASQNEDIIVSGVDNRLQAELTRRNNLITGVGCVIVTHHEWTSDDGDFEVPVHTEKIYELYDGVHVHNGHDAELSLLTYQSYGDDRPRKVQSDWPEYIVKERSVELIGVEFMSGEIWSAKYFKRKQGFFKRCQGFFRKLFCCCSARDY